MLLHGGGRKVSYAGLASAVAVKGSTRIFDNIFKNILDHIPGAKDISILVEDLGDSVRITIQDDGPGVSEDIVARMLDRGFTTRKEFGGKWDWVGFGCSISGKIQWKCKHKGK